MEDGDVEPEDEQDTLCREHDTAYAVDRRTGAGLLNPDTQFVVDSMGNGVYGTGMAIAVGTQAALRLVGLLPRTGKKKLSSSAVIKSLESAMTKSKTVETKKNLRGAIADVKKQSKLVRAEKRAASRDPASIDFAPLSINQKVSMAKPTFRSANGSTIVRHSELVSAVLGSTAFTATPYNINPGCTTSYNWLSSIAASYEKYRFRKLTFHFVPVAATSVSGRLSMSFAFNAVQAVPATSQQMFSIDPNVEGVVWDEYALPIKPDGKEYYVRTVSTNSTIVATPTLDRRLSEMGVLFIATNYGPNANTIGELFVSYEVELINPSVPTILSGWIKGTSATKTNAFPATSTTTSGNAISDSNALNTVAILAPGTYLCAYEVIGTVLGTFTTFSVVSVNGVTYGSVAVSNQHYNVNTASTVEEGYFTLTVTVEPVSQVCLMAPTFNATTVTGMSISIASAMAGVSADPN